MAVILVFVISLCYIKNVGRQGLRVVSSATAYRSGGGDRMSNIELLNVLLAIAGLMLSAYTLGKQNRQ